MGKANRAPRHVGIDEFERVADWAFSVAAKVFAEAGEMAPVILLAKMQGRKIINAGLVNFFTEKSDVSTHQLVLETLATLRDVDICDLHRQLSARSLWSRSVARAVDRSESIKG